MGNLGHEGHTYKSLHIGLHHCCTDTCSINLWYGSQPLVNARLIKPNPFSTNKVKGYMH